METESIREKIRQILSDRAPDGQAPKGDIQVLRPEFIDYDDEGWMTVEFIPQPWQQNGLEVVQGGILGYMMDCCFGPLGYVLSEGSLSGTLDTTVNYLRPVKADGGKIKVKVRFLTNSRRTLNGEGYLYNTQGKIAVTASTNMMKKDRPAG